MAPPKSTPTEDEPPPATRSRSKLVPLLVLAVVVLAGAYVLKGGGGPAASAAAPEPPPEPGQVVTLDTITLNLADGRFLKVGLALQMAKGAPAVAAADLPAFAAPALDDAISVLGARRYPELLAPGARDTVKQELFQRLGERYEGDLLGVYFTEFVMQ